MHPILFQLELYGRSFTGHTYGLLLATGLLAGVAYLLLRRDSRRDMGPLLHEIALLLGLGGFAISYTTRSLIYTGDVFAGVGTHFFGWVLGAAGLLYLYLRVRGLNGPMFFDYLAPTVLLGSALGRVGCFFAGCCHGFACELPLGVYFPVHEASYFPAQLLSASADFTSFLVLAFVLPRRATYQGQTVLWAVWLYCGVRFPIEWLRVEPKVALGLTPAQLIAIGLACASILLRRHLRAHSARPFHVHPAPSGSPSARSGF